MSQDEQPWLVKSGGRILGPFTISKIEELLRSREISVMDEVAPPLRRWQPLQYHSAFADILESLRKSNLSELTEATWTPTGKTSGLTQTLTDVSDSRVTDELTDEITGFTKSGQEIVIHDVKEQPSLTAIPGGAGRYQVSGQQNTAIQRQVERTTRGLWILTAAILSVVAGFILYRRIGAIKLNHMTRSKLKDRVVSDVQIGEYKDALRSMQRYFSDPSRAGDLSIYYGSLLVQIDHQTELGRRVLHQVLKEGGPDQKAAYVSLGLADLLDHQLDSAEQNFSQALSLDPTYRPALVDQAEVALQKGEYGKAHDMVMKIGDGQLPAEALLVLADAELYIFQRHHEGTGLADVNRQIRNYLTRGWDFSAELGFYGLYFDFLHRDSNLNDKIQQYLDMDPDLTADHRHNVFVYYPHSLWNILSRLCEQMVSKLGDNARDETFLASCYTHEGQLDRAQQSIVKAVQEAPKDALVQAWYAYILDQSGQKDQASVVLGRANEMNQEGFYLLPSILQARFCQDRGDWPCAHDAWNEIYQHNIEYLPAVSGLAWYNASKGFKDQAKKLLDKGLSLSPDYKPLLRLRQKAEAEGWGDK